MSGYQHAEAFCHMRYETDDGSDSMWIWNSRDGVTPFIVTLPGTDKPATHADWHLDRRDPDHIPAVGEWVFVDLTPQAARAHAERNADRFWNDPTMPARSMYASKADLVETLVASYLHPGAPDLVRVDEAMRRGFLTRVAAR
jgi:hypothetical protein